VTRTLFVSYRATTCVCSADGPDLTKNPKDLADDAKAGASKLVRQRVRYGAQRFSARFLEHSMHPVSLRPACGCAKDAVWAGCTTGHMRHHFNFSTT
jgi:hypothetical protein